MLRRAFATLLVILTVLPFTAPFPAFDLTHGSHSHTTSVDDGSHALPAFAASARMRTRSISHLDTDLSTHHVSVPAGYVAHSVPSAPRLPDRTSLSVLRI
jgi:hypothetical protein